jgi:hypothetical protein
VQLQYWCRAAGSLLLGPPPTAAEGGSSTRAAVETSTLARLLPRMLPHAYSEAVCVLIKCVLGLPCDAKGLACAAISAAAPSAVLPMHAALVPNMGEHALLPQCVARLLAADESTDNCAELLCTLLDALPQRTDALELYKRFVPAFLPGLTSLLDAALADPNLGPSLPNLGQGAGGVGAGVGAGAARAARSALKVSAAALLLEGTEGASVTGCSFERLDGTALMVSGYNRDARITDNDFSWIGGSAMVAWGRTTGDPTGADGPDGTGGDQPRYTLFARNVGRELGIWEKQSSFVFQAVTAGNHYEGNVAFNGPRAGVNWNDGFMGGHNLTRNVIFNMCRESSDHGNFNSWDRQVYMCAPSPLTLQPLFALNHAVAAQVRCT